MVLVSCLSDSNRRSCRLRAGGRGEQGDVSKCSVWGFSQVARTRTYPEEKRGGEKAVLQARRKTTIDNFFFVCVWGGGEK